MDGYRRKKRSIKGWLILPILGLALTPIRVLIFVFTTFTPIFQNGTIAALITPSSEHFNPGLAALIFGEIAVNGLIIFGSLFLLYLAILRSHWFPRGMIVYYILTFLFILGDHLVTLFAIGFSSGDQAFSQELVRAILGVGIWVPYFLVSTRVKETFVR